MLDSHAIDILYHYTTGVGLRGIIESKTLWATDSRFLNDLSEIPYSRDLLATVVEQTKDEYDSADTAANDLFGLAQQVVQAPDTPPTFIACLCAEGDLLSQWRGYGAGGGGYALGMNRKRLRDIAFDQGVDLMPVLYEVADQTTLLSTTLRDNVEYLKQPRVQTSVASEDRDVVLGISLTEAMLEVKNPHFREEKEWRLARTAWDWRTPNPPTYFRTRDDVVIPYQEISLVDSESTTDAFEVITIGPTPDPSTTAEGIRDMLDHNDLAHVRIQRSEVPLRG